MSEATGTFERRTTTDVVFEHLYKDIVSLNMLPGTKLSESEVANRFSVSRQPVRDAFGRLANLELLLVRPQKATQVRGFSLERIAHARFIRLAVELEVLNRACLIWDDTRAEVLQTLIDEQRLAMDDGKNELFHTLDGHFHSRICDLSGHPAAAEVMSECRQKIDRLCVLSMGRGKEAATLVDDHANLADALVRRSISDATDITRLHLGRLDDTISRIHESHSEYFE